MHEKTHQSSRLKAMVQNFSIEKFKHIIKDSSNELNNEACYSSTVLSLYKEITIDADEEEIMSEVYHLINDSLAMYIFLVRYISTI